MAAASAGADRALANYKVDIGPLPVACNQHVPHAALSKGQDIIIALKAERLQLDKSNSVRKICVQYHDNLRKGLLAGRGVGNVK